ncbi:MAG: PRC-barrel domain-containing protein, partial [Candidatus Dormiibacterota bacterium]
SGTGRSMEFTFGAAFSCTDGVGGELRRVIVDPNDRRATHLVVGPQHWTGMGRLVPMDLVETGGEEPRLRCSKSELEALKEADEVQFLAGAGGQWGFGFGLGGMGAGYAGPQAFISDRVPAGEIEMERGDPVLATDGGIGRVQGLVLDATNHRVLQILLAEGHLWGRKRVLIPIGAVSTVKDGVHLNLTKDQVRDLPPVDSAPTDLAGA